MEKQPKKGPSSRVEGGRGLPERWAPLRRVMGVPDDSKMGKVRLAKYTDCTM